MLIIHTTCEAEIGRILKASSGRKKVSTSKLGVVAHAYDPSYTGGIGRSAAIHGQFQAKSVRS
jgi:hypothetical protein